MSTAVEHLDELAKHQQEWARSTPEDKVAVAKEILTTLHSDEWTTVGYWADEETRLNQMDPHSPSGPARVALNRFFIGSMLKDILGLLTKTASEPQKGTLPTLRRRVDAETVAFGPCPVGSVPGIAFELWCKQREGEDSRERGEHARAAQEREGKVTVVLGAGNQSFLALVDVLLCIFFDSQCVLLKHHPLRPWLAGPYGLLLAPLTARGVFRQIIDEGKEAATQLCCHPLVQRVHLTGSHATAAAVEKAMTAAGKQNFEVTGELGGAGSWIIAPGHYTARELTHAARMVVTAKKTSGGNNCLSAQVLVLPQSWPQKDAFMAALRAELKRQPTFPSYYPNARSRRRQLFQHYAALGPLRAEECPTQRCQPHDPLPPPREALALGGSGADGSIADDHPCLLFCGVPGSPDFDGTAMAAEAFCPALAVVELPEPAAGGSYLTDVAAPLVNSDAVFGSLTVSVVAPKSLPSSELEAAVAQLEFGCVAVNTWAVWGFMAVVTGGGSWGAHPSDIANKQQSGNIVAGNGWRLRNPEKTVLRGPPLRSAPVLDAAQEPPGLVLDAAMAAVTSLSALGALGSVCRLLGGRLLQNLLALLGLARGLPLYGSAGSGPAGRRKHGLQDGAAAVAPADEVASN